MHVSKRGFTLIELIVVIAIIAILASIITAGLTSAKAAGRDARRVGDIKNIQISLALYYNDNNHYPCDIGTYSTGTCAPAFSPAYMSTVPKDPDGTAYIYSSLQYDLVGEPLTCANKTVASYHLGAVMEVTKSSILTQDADAAVTGYYCNQAAASFNGNADKCVSGATVLSAATAGDENCYDVAPGS